MAVVDGRNGLGYTDSNIACRFNVTTQKTADTSASDVLYGNGSGEQLLVW